jgi:hypothetical protein
MSNVVIDLSKLIQQTQEDYEEFQSRSAERGDDYKIFYPSDNGKFLLKLLFNVQSQTVQRKIIRHSKVPCLQMYGEDCPVCNAIENIINVKGKKTGIENKYGYKVRGICYAKIIDHQINYRYFNKPDGPQVGDVILFMYPITIYKGITKIFMDAGEHLASLVSENDGLLVEVERSQKAGGFPEYSINVYPYGKVKVFKDQPDRSGDDQFLDLLAELPNINNAVVPHMPDAETRDKVRALAETIVQEYLKGNAVNPGDTKNKVDDEVDDEVDDKIDDEDVRAEAIQNQVRSQAETAKENKASQSTGSFFTVPRDFSSEHNMPPCFGSHIDGDTKCLACPHEADCYINTSGV